MEINVHTIGRDSIGIQLFDHVYAYFQFLDRDNNYKTNSKIHIGPVRPIVPNSINILFASMLNNTIDDIDNYDLILLDNADEPLEVSTDIMYDLVNKHNHVYLVANAILSNGHYLCDRIIPTLVDGNNFCDYQSRPFYPQYYLDKTTDNRKNLIYINGTNRAHRWHMIDLLTQQVPELPIKNSLSEDMIIAELNDCFYESVEDSQFRDWVNNYYPISRNMPFSLYYDNSVSCGIDFKFGKVPPGYFTLDEYFEYKCVIYPEASWINHELCVTEKILKCFYANALPFPIAGAGVNFLYNQIGFYTAWNLLPADLQRYDQVLDHRDRYNLVCQSIKYLHNNPEVFATAQCKEYIKSNYLNGRTYKFALPGVTKFLEIVKKL